MVSRSKINKKVMQQICDRIAQGESLLTVVADPNVPTSYDIMMSPLPTFEDNRQANAYVTNNRNKVDALKWVIARMQPNGIRDKKEDAPQNSAITISWQGNDVAVTPAEETPGTE